MTPDTTTPHGGAPTLDAMADEPARCSSFKCQWWETIPAFIATKRPMYPVLVYREPFWYCPNCELSYGVHAQEPFDRAMAAALDDTP